MLELVAFGMFFGVVLLIFFAPLQIKQDVAIWVSKIKPYYVVPAFLIFSALPAHIVTTYAALSWAASAAIFIITYAALYFKP